MIVNIYLINNDKNLTRSEARLNFKYQQHEN